MESLLLSINGGLIIMTGVTIIFCLAYAITVAFSAAQEWIERC